MNVAVVVLSWNGREETLACLASLARVEYEHLTVVVVDNGSKDGSPEAIASSFPAVELLRLPSNLGFAGGMNAGIRLALAGGADAVVTLNNDMVVDSNFIAPLAEALDSDPRAGAACAQILFADGSDRIWYAGARYRRRRGYQGRHTLYGRPPLPPGTPAYVTDRACGGAMLMSRSVLERVGLFDESLFAYAEDVDWSLRAHRLGLHVLVIPASIVRHHVSASTGGESSPTTIYYDTRNGLAVAERHVPLGSFATVLRRLESLTAHLIQVLVSPRRREGLAAALDGWRDLRAGRLGERR
jgi:GT2 family glycosyltransferase